MINWWLLIGGIGILLLRLGSTLHQAGMVRSKNSAGMIIRSIADLAIAILAFACIGAPILLGFSPLKSLATPDAALTFFLAASMLIATAIPLGVVAERSRFWPMLAISVLLSALIVPLAADWILAGGWLQRKGMHDLAGAGFLHLPAALCAAVASLFVGPRANKYNRDGSSNAIPGHSVPLASTGILLTLVGFFPYILGFAWLRSEALVPIAALNLLLALSAGILAALLFSQLRYGKIDIHLTYCGLMGALVALSACADVNASWKALLIGAVAGIVTPILTLIIDLIWKIDDPTGGIAIHGGGALWGLLAAALLSPMPPTLTRFEMLLWQILGILAISALAIAASVAMLMLLRLITPLRSKEADEYDGLDLAEHDIGAYPDFQQTMIKSYHLREA